MRIGVTLQGVDDPASFGELARWIEGLGYDDLWLTDSSLHAGEVYVYATLALAATSRLRVGTAVTNPITRHPAITANAAGTLARLAPGRFVCGIGVGLTLPTILSSATSGLPPARSATGSAIVTMTRQIGTVLGVSMLIALLGSPTGYPAVHAAFRGAWAAVAATGLISAAVSPGLSPRPAAR